MTLSVENDDPDDELLSTGQVTRLLRLLAPGFAHQKPTIAALSAVFVLEGSFNAAFSLALMFLVDDALLQRNQHALVVILIALAASGFVVSIAGLAGDYLAARLLATVVSNVRSRLFAQVQRLRMDFFAQEAGGAVLARFSGDLQVIETALSSVASWCVLPAIELVISVGILFWMHVGLASLAMSVFVLAWFGPRLLARSTLNASYTKRVHESDVLAMVQENLGAQHLLRAFGRGPWAMRRFTRANSTLSQSLRTLHFRSALVERSAGVAVLLVHLLVVSVGAWLTFRSSLTIGTLIGFESVFLGLSDSVTYLTQFIPTAAQAAGASEHLRELFAEEELIDVRDDESADGVLRSMPRPTQSIELRDVSFCYAERAVPVFENLNLKIPYGAYAAIVGESGAGKSTLLQLLLRFHEPTDGKILVDDVDVRSFSSNALRRQMGVVFQESLLFDMSVRENIAMGNDEVTELEIESAAKRAQIHDFVRTLPDGYDTMVGPEGNRLSGGQRQRLAIARAIVRDPAILLLDEATSALDGPTEASIHHTLMTVRSGRTVISATHRLPLVVSADVIFVLHGGQVAEHGTHADLLGVGGRYAALWARYSADPH
ncbi:MAG: ABC transporter ATP-binding protein [Gemmatimonadaceae bacterium]